MDNNSSDATGKLADKYCSIYSHFRYVKELKQGLSYARNHGFHVAKGEYVAYIDDDAMADPNWVQAIIDFLTENPYVKVFGGPCYPYYKSPTPLWFPSHFGLWRLPLEKGDLFRKVSIPSEWINGPNMIFEKKLLKEMGGFNIALGMKGKTIGYGEETALLLTIKEKGIPIYYLKDLKVNHLVADYKMQLRWLLSSNYNCGLGHYKIFNSISRYEMLRIIYYLAKSLLKFFKQLLQVRQPIKRRIYEGGKDFCYVAGRLIGFLNLKNSL